MALSLLWACPIAAGCSDGDHAAEQPPSSLSSSASLQPSSSPPAAAAPPPSSAPAAAQAGRRVEAGLSVAGRVAVLGAKTASPPAFSSRQVAPGLTLLEAPSAPAPQRSFVGVWPGQICRATSREASAMALVRDGESPEWRAATPLDGCAPPGAELAWFYAVEGEHAVTWRHAMAGISREAIACTRFEGLEELVEGRGDQGERIARGGRFIGQASLSGVVGAFEVDGSRYLWLAAPGATELVDLQAGTAMRDAAAPVPLRPAGEKPSCPEKAPSR